MTNKWMLPSWLVSLPALLSSYARQNALSKSGVNMDFCNNYVRNNSKSNAGSAFRTGIKNVSGGLMVGLNF